MCREKWKTSKVVTYQAMILNISTQQRRPFTKRKGAMSGGGDVNIWVIHNINAFMRQAHV